MKASPHRAAPCGAQPPGSSMNAIPPFAHLCEPAASLEDGHGRTVRYIRLSVTDRCNLRCTYCRSGMETFIPHESVLRYEEMEQLVDMAMDMGVEKVRLTGGEPFARKGFADFLERLRAAHPALDIRVTTNGTLIGPHIQTLKAIGLNAVNLSLDTFDRDKFEQITGRDLFGKVRENMDALLDAGIPFKLNAVAMRGFNDDELPAFIDYAMRHPIDVRFIEFMPMGEGTRWSDSCFWSAPDILDAVKGLVAVAPVEQEQRNGGPARLYTLSGPDGPGLGRLGLISPLSSHFCTSCNRLRITSDGALRTCLFDDREYRLRNALRHPKLGIEAVRRIVTLATRDKPIGRAAHERRHNAVAQRRMTAIGGGTLLRNWGGRRNFLEKVSPPPPKPLSSSKTFDFIESLFVIFLESAFLLGNAYFNAERLQAGFISRLRPRKDAFSPLAPFKNSSLVNPKEHIFSATGKTVGWIR